MPVEQTGSRAAECYLRCLDCIERMADHHSRHAAYCTSNDILSSKQNG